MKFLTLALCVALAPLAQAAAADDISEPARLKQVADEIRARRALRTMNEEDRIKLVFIEDQLGIRLTLKDRHLVECREGFELLLKKEILMTRAAAAKRLSLETNIILPDAARELLTKKLDELDVTVVELGDSALLFVTKSQAPK